MKKIKTVILTLVFASNLVAQEWAKQIGSQSKLISSIINNDEWEEIYRIAKKELKLPIQSMTDLEETIEFLNKHQESSKIDHFFHAICDTVYSSFPYRASGRLSNRLYHISVSDASQNDITVIEINGKCLYSKFAEIISVDEKILLPQLLKYLENDAATRLCIRPIEWGEPPFFLSISDVAMELIEVKTYCDFFDNASHSQKLFSNLSDNGKNEIIEKVKKWMDFSNEKTRFQSVEYFLDSLCEIGHSYRFTCHNLLFSGDTIGAKRMYTKIYEQTKLPCRQDFNVGEILLELGDKRILDDCSDKIHNYRCSLQGWENLGLNCVEILFNSDQAWYRDDIFAEIIATEPHSTYRVGRRKAFIWHYIFDMLPNYTERKLIKSLVQLMKIRDELNLLNERYTDDWKRKYPEEFALNYRVCDFALLRFSETIEKELKIEGGSIDEKKKMSETLKELKSLNWDSLYQKDRMISSIIIKYED